MSAETPRATSSSVRSPRPPPALSSENGFCSASWFTWRPQRGLVARPFGHSGRAGYSACAVRIRAPVDSATLNGLLPSVHQATAPLSRYAGRIRSHLLSLTLSLSHNLRWSVCSSLAAVSPESYSARTQPTTSSISLSLLVQTVSSSCNTDLPFLLSSTS